MQLGRIFCILIEIESNYYIIFPILFWVIAFCGIYIIYIFMIHLQILVFWSFFKCLGPLDPQHLILSSPLNQGL